VTLAAAAATAVLATGLAGGAAAPVKVTLAAPGHTPKVGVRWHYTVRATAGGKPVAGRITVQIVDPVGGRHAVEFGRSTKKIVRWPFRGVFRDYVIWPASSRGVPLTFHVLVTVGKARRVVDYRVTPHG